MFEATKNVVRILGSMIKTAEVLKRFAITESQLKYLHKSLPQFGIISAYRSEYGRNKNKQRHTELIQYVNSRGYKWEETQGSWSDPSSEKGYGLESSIIIHDILYNEILDLGEYYDQEAFIFKESGGLLGLYNLYDNTVVVWKDWETVVDMGSVRPKDLDELGIEQQNSTRFRDVEVVYEFDLSTVMPLNRSTPISIEEYYNYYRDF